MVTLGVIDPAPQLDEEVDRTLLEWFRGLSIVERLRITSRNAAVLERLRRAASQDR